MLVLNILINLFREFIIEFTRFDSQFWYYSNYPKGWLLLSQIKGSVVVLRDRIHRERGHTIEWMQSMIKLGKHIIKQ